MTNSPLKDLQGKNCVITGGAGILGASMAEALALAGSIAKELAMNKIGMIRQRFEVTAAIIIGLFVGVMVIAMYLPIFKMGQIVG